MNENKVPCGGFRIGDGLTMDGNTLKSLGGAYIKVVEDEEHPETYKIADDSPLNYETAMKYDGLIFMLQQNYNEQTITLLHTKASNALIFHDYIVLDSSIIYFDVSVFEDNSINIERSQYTLTPTT